VVTKEGETYTQAIGYFGAAHLVTVGQHFYHTQASWIRERLENLRALLGVNVF